MWSENGELKSKSAQVFFKDSLLEHLELYEKASILFELPTDSLYNQMAAEKIYALFDSSGSLQNVDATGQAWTIFYPESEKKINDSTIEVQREGLNRLFAERLFVELEKGEVKQITYFDQPDGIFYPMDRIEAKEKRIKGFEWNPRLRPKNPLDLRKD